MSEDNQDETAYSDLLEALRPGETVEAITFCDWMGYERDPGFVPADKRGVALTLEEARPFMSGWAL